MRPGPDAPSLAAALIIVLAGLGTASDAGLNSRMICQSMMQRCNAAYEPAAEDDSLTLRLASSHSPLRNRYCTHKNLEHHDAVCV